jgi:cation:H+ antiporter
VAGFIYLLMGGDLLVRGAVGLARRLRIPAAVVAATAVGFGTSLPELVVSVHATVTGYPNLILGNVVGSNIANVLLVAGAAAAIYPLVHDDAAVRRNSVIMMTASAVFAAVCVFGSLGRPVGALLLTSFVVIMAATAGSTLRAKRDADTSTPLDWVLGLPHRHGIIAVFIVAGLVMLPLGAQMLVRSAAEIAAIFEVPETVVGLTILAVGTSLPELTTTVLAALERRSDVAIGAIVGSNIFNILTIMGVSALLSPEPIPVSARFVTFDLPVMMVSSAGLAWFAWRARPIGRPAGIAMLLGYCVYLATLFTLV